MMKIAEEKSSIRESPVRTENPNTGQNPTYVNHAFNNPNSIKVPSSFMARWFGE